MARGALVVKKNMKLDALVDNLEDKTKILNAMASPFMIQISATTPVDTNTLRGSLDYKIQMDQLVIFYAAGFSEVNSFNYAYHLHSTPGWTPRKNKQSGFRWMAKALNNKSVQLDALENAAAVIKDL